MGVITRLLISLFSVNKISHGDRCQTPSCRIQSPIKPLIWSIYWSPSYWSPISLVPFSLVPQLVGPPNTLLELIGPHLIGPQSHWSPVSLVPLFISHRTISPSEWSPSRWSPPPPPPPDSLVPISLVTHLIGSRLTGPPIHKSPTTLLEPIDLPSHWSPFSLVHPFWPIPMVPHLTVPPSHWSPIPLVPQYNPGYLALIGPPSHWSPSHWSPISLVPHLIGSLLTGPPIHKSPTTLFELIGSLLMGPHPIPPSSTQQILDPSIKALYPGHPPNRKCQDYAYVK